VEIVRVMVQYQPGQKVSEIPISTKKLGMAHAFYPSYMGNVSKRTAV
jgi:ribosomal protein L21E